MRRTLYVDLYISVNNMPVKIYGVARRRFEYMQHLSGYHLARVHYASNG